MGRLGVEMRWVLLCCVGLLLAAGCGEEAKHPHAPYTPSPPVYFANTSPDSLLANLVTAWEAMDAQGYAALLYDGSGLGLRDDDYPGFYFLFDQTANPGLPASWDYDTETACVAHLLSGLAGEIEPGRSLPGVKSVSVLLTPLAAWAPVDEDPPGQDCPPGTQRLSAQVRMLFELKDEIGGTNVYRLLVDDGAVFHCVRIVTAEGIEYRLWRWAELVGRGGLFAGDGGGSTERTTLGTIKSCHVPEG